MGYSYMIISNKYNKATQKFNKKIEFLAHHYDEARIWCLTLANPKNRDMDYIIPQHPEVEKQGNYYKNQGYFPTYEELQEFGSKIKVRLFENDCFLISDYQIIPLKKIQKKS